MIALFTYGRSWRRLKSWEIHRGWKIDREALRMIESGPIRSDALFELGCLSRCGLDSEISPVLMQWKKKISEDAIILPFSFPWMSLTPVRIVLKTAAMISSRAPGIYTFFILIEHFHRTAGNCAFFVNFQIHCVM